MRDKDQDQDVRECQKKTVVSTRQQTPEDLYRGFIVPCLLACEHKVGASRRLQIRGCDASQKAGTACPGGTRRSNAGLQATGGQSSFISIAFTRTNCRLFVLTKIR